MPFGSLFNKNRKNRKQVSLSTKMFNTILMFSLVLSAAAIIFGFRLYSNAVISQYAKVAYNISKTAAIVLKEENAIHYHDEVYKIYKYLTNEELQRKDSPEYRLLYADAIDNKMVDMQIILGKIAQENG